MKFFLIYIYAFLYNETYHWFIIALLLVLSFMCYHSYRYLWPFYDDFMNRYFSCLLGIFFWCNVCLLAVKILEYTSFDGGLQIFFLGLPVVVACIAFDKDERVFILTQNIANFQRGEEAALQIRYFLNLVLTRDNDRRNAIILRGYIYHHEDSCNYADC